MKHHLITLTGVFAALCFIFFYAPTEVTQGWVQKVFYIHVPCALTMYMGFFIAFLSALAYLFSGQRVQWDAITVSAIEVAFFLCTIVLLTGPIWAKPIWGAWWTWDPRLTTTLLLWLIYGSGLVLRSYTQDLKHSRIITNVLAVIAFLDVPLVHYSIRLWRGIHPSVIGQGDDSLPYAMKLTLWISLAAILLLFSSLFRIRLELEQNRHRLLALLVQGERED